MLERRFCNAIQSGNSMVFVLPDAFVKAHAVMKGDVLDCSFSAFSSIVIYNKGASDAVVKAVEKVQQSGSQGTWQKRQTRVVQLGVGFIVVLPKPFVKTHTVQRGDTFEAIFSSSDSMIAFRKLRCDYSPIEKVIAKLLQEDFIDFEKMKQVDEVKDAVIEIEKAKKEIQNQ